MFSVFPPPMPEGFLEGSTTMDITLRDLNAMDEIAIRTRHSEYRFRVTDPDLCRGILTGGVLGDEEHDAVFAGASVPDDVKDELQHELPGKVEIGGCALFYVAVDEGVSFMTTSRITDLTLAEVHDPIYVPA